MLPASASKTTKTAERADFKIFINDRELGTCVVTQGDRRPPIGACTDNLRGVKVVTVPAAPQFCLVRHYLPWT